MKNKPTRILTLFCLIMLCLTSISYAQGKKGKAGAYPPPPMEDYEKKGKAREYSVTEGFMGAREYPVTEGFTGTRKPSSILVTKTGQIQSTPAASAKSLAYDTPIMLVGKVIRYIGEDLYSFKDSSGEIIVRIKQGDWKGLSIEETDSVVIAGYVKTRSDGQVEIDVKVISKAKV